MFRLLDEYVVRPHDRALFPELGEADPVTTVCRKQRQRIHPHRPRKRITAAGALTSRHRRQTRNQALRAGERLCLSRSPE